ncbi:hypothetical protein [Kitasatospora sp. NPDC050543]|uniref:hypothetical protein n=1 Tax=Kitasatospora sp. NPDC050543 TaxID=3364054 RepID=UPI0037A129AF
MRTTTTRVARTAGVLLAAGLVGLTGTAAAHAADAQPGRQAAKAGGDDTRGSLIPGGANFVLCSNGSYASYAVFPKRGNMATVIATPGNCVGLKLTGESKEKVVLYGIKPNGSSFKIATDTFDDSDGERIQTLNNPGNNDWKTF